ncbi:Mut7-C RNAse domain-containing protein [Haloparvum sp. PAK95]|uniref:Mut7-C RNAse domain-containing protein n=1 Tax=Haloparvum sp. PAK95 TaxID=3418962 RepID=UPI003D2EC632
MADGETDGAGPADRTPESTPLLLDVMCGTLATYLRMCGYDAVYALDRDVEADERIREIAAAEDRTVLTRDEELAARADDAVLLTERDPLDQLRELREDGFQVELDETPSRCGRCNGRLRRLPADAERPDYAPDEGPVWRCRDCGQCFWKGSHWERVEDRLETL